MQVYISDFDIAKISESGQCFRMNRNGDGSYGVVHAGKYLKVAFEEQSPEERLGMYSMSCTEEEYNSVWSRYFDISYDYSSISSLADESDVFLNNAIKYGTGIRILQQDPWEMLVSFIISQRKSIPAIRTSIEKLCRLCGDKIEIGETQESVYYSFPNAEQIAALTMEQLDSCSLGYRSRYIYELSRKAASGELDVHEIAKLNDEDLRNELLKIFGVGNKVANCVMLFGYHRLDAFPEDVWIKRALQNEYPNGFPFERYKGFGGIMQQYIFFYMRSMNITAS